MPAALQRLDTRRIHLFRADDYDGGESWSAADLDDVVRNHRLTCPKLWRPPIGIGHEEATAELAYGTVTRLWREGHDLWGSYGEVSPELERLLRGGYLRHPSVELYRDPSEGNFSDRLIPGLRGAMLRRVVYLGAWPPRVKGLKEASFAAGERRQRADGGGRYCTRPGRIFGEAIMDREHLMQVAQQAGFGQRFLDGLDDEQLSGLVADLAGRMLGGGDATGGPGGPGAADTTASDLDDGTGTGTDTGTDTGADMGTPSRDQMIQDLVAAGQDEQTLQQMDDAALKELWQQLAGGAAAAATPAPGTYGERSRSRSSGGRPQVIQLSPRTLQQLVRAEARTAAAKVAAPDRARKVVEFCEQMVRDGLLTPAQVERDQHGKPLGAVIKRLLRASPICFAEGTPSELEQQMEEIRGGGRVRTYGERMADAPGGVVGTGGATAAFDAKLDSHYKARNARFDRRA